MTGNTEIIRLGKSYRQIATYPNLCQRQCVSKPTRTLFRCDRDGISLGADSLRRTSLRPPPCLGSSRNVASIRVLAKLRSREERREFPSQGISRSWAAWSSPPNGDLDRRSISWCWPIVSLLQTISPTLRARSVIFKFSTTKGISLDEFTSRGLRCGCLWCPSVICRDPTSNYGSSRSRA